MYCSATEWKQKMVVLCKFSYIGNTIGCKNRAQGNTLKYNGPQEKDT